ncbi:unnamed protein product [Nippostrongylus brasiliensis]|uniref:EF hand n=1 Tax=Nippostrongylus brasiliensis TaxID=27835 RepID=A0A0N4YEE2_NIPBR|nr:hypothetical protein Q1695_014967 [Nippostrongylus brasiliensis]VDL78647.1 unnamed protein product [Nippostrongylus brasiliensis]
MIRNIIAAAVTVALVVAETTPPTIENVNSFDSVDTDQNGAIDFNEFEKWHKSIRNEHSDSKIKSIFTKYDVTRDQVLDVAEFVPLAVEYSKKPIETAEQVFRKLDLNNDGTVDRNEAEIARKLYDAGIIDGVLAVADTNNDGELTFEEFSAQLHYGKPKSPKEANKEMAYQVLNYIDVNQDGKLSAQEVHNFARLYNNLSDDEIARVINALDFNRDGFLVVSELERIPSQIAQLANIAPPPNV